MSQARVLQTTISIDGVMSDSLRRAVQSVNRQLESIDKQALETAASIGTKISDAAKTAAKAMAGLGTAAAGLAVGVFVKGGQDYIRTMNGISAQTGVTGEELKEFGQIAQNIYKTGKGESMQEIADALVNIRQASGLAGDELKNAANAAVLLKDSFGMETEETTRAAMALMKNFGISAEEAYGLIAYGAQNGANKNGDLLDTLNEYSVHYKALGLDANAFVQTLVNGADMGAFSIDKIGDAVKEFSIKAKDGSKTSAEGFEALGLNAETMTAQFAQGGRVAEAAFLQTVKALESMQDPVAKNAAGVALFGTMYEDLESGVLKAFTSMNGAAIDAEKTLRDIEAVKYNDLGYAITQIGRSFETALIPSAEKAGQTIFEQMPAIQASIDKVVPYVTALGEAFAAALPGIIDWLGSAAQTAAKFAGTVADNWSIIEPILLTAGGLFAAVKLVQFAKNTYAVGKAVSQLTLAYGKLYIAKGKDLALTGKILALYARDAVAKGLSAARSLAAATALGVQTAATVAWSAVCAVAQGVTMALGAAFAFLTSPIGLVVLAIAGAVAAGVALYKNWDTVKEKAAELGAWIGDKWQDMKDSVSEITGELGEALSAQWEEIKSSVSELAGQLGDYLSDKWTSIKDNVSGVVGKLGASLRAKWSEIKDSASASVSELGTSLSDGWSEIKNRVSSLASELAGSLGDKWDSIKETADGKAAEIAASLGLNWGAIKDTIGGIAGQLSGNLQNHWENIRAGADFAAGLTADALAGRWSDIGTKVSGLTAQLGENLSARWTAITTTVGGLAAQLGGALSEQWIWIKDTASIVSAQIGETLSANWTGIKTNVSAIASQLGTALGSKWSEIFFTATNFANQIGVELSSKWTSIKTSVSGLAGQLGDFVSNVWTKIGDGTASLGNSIKSLLTSAFGAIPGILKSPINAAISLINSAIGSINGIGFTIPEWVPGIGGKAFSVDVPKIPLLAKGGFTQGVSIAGEAGQEAVISFDPAYRQQNIGYLTKAASMLGLETAREGTIGYYAQRIESLGGGESLSSTTNNATTYNLGGITFAPTVTVEGGAEKKETVIEQLRNYQGELLDMIEDLLATKEAGSYGASGVF